jgi:uncharacterized protein (TIGR03437 family)
MIVMKVSAALLTLGVLALAPSGFGQTQILITLTSVPSGTVGQPYFGTVSSNGGSGTVWTISAGGLPPGLSLSAPENSAVPKVAGASVQISGTPTQAGTFYFTLQATNGEGAGSASFSITINGNGSFSFQTQSPLPGGIVGQGYDLSLSLSGGVAPYSFSISPGTSQTGINGFPPGLMINSSATIDGNPTTAGVYFFTINATDYHANSTSMAFMLTIAAPVSITTVSPLPSGIVGTVYPQTTLAATGGFAPYTFFISTGAIPAGLSLSPAGLLSGTPTAAGTFTFTVQVTDAYNYGATMQFQVTVAGSTPLLQVSPAALAFAAFTGGDSPPAQMIQIVAAGSTAINFAVTVDAGSAAPWISVTPSSGVTPGSLTVTVNPGNMSTATYNATIHITVPGNTAQAPINVPVTFTVSQASPQLQASPASLSFGARVQTASVQTQVIVLRNSGGGGPINYSTAIAGESPWISVAPATGQTAPNSPVLLQIVVNSQGLAVGNLHDILQITWSGGVINVPISLFVASQGSILSVGVNGVLFEARQGNGNGQIQNVSVLNVGDPSTTVNFTASVLSGSDWAILTNASGAATPATPGSFSVSVGGDAETVPVGGAYALIQVSDPNALNSPQYVAAVLSIEPASNLPEPHPYPAGVYLTTSTSSQNVTVFTSSITPANFQTSASTTDGAKWLTVTPASGITSTQTPAPISISANATGLANGVYTGNVNVSENGQIRSVNVTFLVTGQTASLEAPRATGCTPSRVTLAGTALSNNFDVPAGWPASLIVLLNDDCGNPVSNGSVVASFSNGDPPLTLAGDQHTNVYSATWQPSTVIPSMTVTMRAASGALLPATQQFAGAVESNTSPAPTLIPGGTLHIFFNVPTADALGNGLAPGNIAQVYGTGMASTAQSPGVVPLLNIFDGTFMLIGGVQVPLYYVSTGQLDIQVPFELAANRQYTAIVSANGALTLPETLNIVPVQPGMAANADGSVIAQHGDYSLVTAAHPAAPGEQLMIYLAGMGATNPPVASGAATPLELVPANVKPTVSVDGQNAAISYWGLAPGLIGLYQINFTVPSNANAGNLSLVVMQGGLSSNTTTLPVN